MLPQGIRLLGQRAIEALSNPEHELCEPFRTLIQLLVEHLRELGNKAAELEGRIRAMDSTDEAGQLLETIPGVAPLTASALAASIGSPHAFLDGRELAVNLTCGRARRPQPLFLCYPRPTNGILLAIMVMNCTFASSGKSAI